MAINQPLNGVKVLVTRPQQQAQTLCDQISNAGGEAISFPVIKIAKIPYDQWADHDLDKQDFIIFISRNAVANFVSEIKEPWFGNSQLVAIGSGTAESMLAHNLSVDIQPRQSSGSEGLLAASELAMVAGKNILIVRGKGGRELLAESLAARGAKISYIEVYERLLASPTEMQCRQALEADTIVCTSVKGVQNLCVLLNNDMKALLEKTMIVVSERIKREALSLGFQRVVVTTEISDESIVSQLIEMEK